MKAAYLWAVYPRLARWLPPIEDLAGTNNEAIVAFGTGRLDELCWGRLPVAAEARLARRVTLARLHTGASVPFQLISAIRQPADRRFSTVHRCVLRSVS